VAIGASDGKMEEGSLRVDANVSVRPVGETPFRTRCEIKNLNSLRSLVRAITFEAHRQVAAYLAGEKVTQQTRHWDESASRTVALRNKEEAEDYRYFPEPDLVPLRPSEEWIESLRSQLGELPKERRARLVESLGLTETNDQIETAISVELYPFVRSALAAGLDPKITVARCANELASLAPLDHGFEISWFIELLKMEIEGKVSATQAKSILAEVAKNLIPPRVAQERLGLSQLTDDQLTKTINEAILQNPKEWERFRTGEAQLQGFFVGKIMKATSGKADGKAVVRILLALAEQR
jgi:aspartyl-tRNA(Asn)/glutamyl-tRNA(Gln) amidotransferase subunit B